VTTHDMAKLMVAMTPDQADHPLTPLQANFLTCIFEALIASVPCFIQNFLACMSRPPTPGYNPGTRDRCD